MNRAPSVGDIVIVDFDPQAGKRPALVLSPVEFNKVTGLAWVCPVTNQEKGYPFEVKVQGARKTKGVILTDQLKSLDWSARNLHKVDKVNVKCLTEVKNLVSTILGI
jgi:mRNA interferase MazF